QWLLQASRYFFHAHSYLNGTSWFRSARQLMIFLSSTWIRRAPISNDSRPVAPVAGGGTSAKSLAGAVGTASGSGCDSACSARRPTLPSAATCASCTAIALRIGESNAGGTRLYLDGASASLLGATVVSSSQVNIRNSSVQF